MLTGRVETLRLRLAVGLPGTLNELEGLVWTDAYS